MTHNNDRPLVLGSSPKKWAAAAAATTTTPAAAASAVTTGEARARAKRPARRRTMLRAWTTMKMHSTTATPCLEALAAVPRCRRTGQGRQPPNLQAAAAAHWTRREVCCRACRFCFGIGECKCKLTEAEDRGSLKIYRYRYIRTYIHTHIEGRTE